ncbi:ORC-CDC6 family AAA ATPase [Vibrio casei]|uniref:Zinc ribbon domain-containing protein n=1 Tax=Vibrio casei TaxID=673372 RepID=A0A368LP14_9VIBR|nr:zinc ribbon domain-containing protein [Vibrio casei]RCS73555.1 zinc ribbon domain-containing protein [Vibrio casei]SJN25847.1 hypothetical protein FM109_06325 [Vibrio casei]
MGNDDKDLIENTIEQRADFIPSENLKGETAENDFFNNIVKDLIKRQTTLIVGPRGCGKTHMMRYASLLCEEDKTKPYAIYVTFNRYYRLEPMLTSKIDAISLFHSWVLAGIIISAHETLVKINPDISHEDMTESLNFLEIDSLKSLIGMLEKGVNLTDEELYVARELSLSGTKNILENMRVLSGRARSILLLDDAALTLTPDYMKEFFDIFRTLKSSKLSPKASVYPGTTEYGARFHPTQEGGVSSVWLSIEDSSYSETMDIIAQKRVSNFRDISPNIREYLKYAAFGIPRAYLSMLQDYQDGGFRSQQQGLNRIIQSHIGARIEEFKSITFKSPKLKSLIQCGDNIFDKICEDLKKDNEDKQQKNLKQLKIGISGIDSKPHVERMFNLLVEAGLLYELPEKVSHGGSRDYIRYIPHIAALFDRKVFMSKGTGTSTLLALERLSLPSAKHPLRRSISTLITKTQLTNLKFNLPPCGHCGTDRINQSQKFCHNCGSELIDSSSFEACMSLPLHEIPGLTKWMKSKIKNEIPKFKNIGDFLSSQDPSKDLREADQIGQARAQKIIILATGFVDDFLQ